jgi:1-acyl-sn-glycerol-3-phosphate acyltransferase
MQAIFLFLFDFFERRKVALYTALVIVFLLSILGATRITFETDINKMIPHDPAIEAMNDVLNKTKTGEQVVFTLAFNDTTTQLPDSLIALQQDLQVKISAAAPGYIKSISAQVSDEKEQQFSSIALQYLPLLLHERDYAKIDSLIRPEVIKKSLKRERQLLLSPAGFVAKDWIAADPVGIVPIALQKLQHLNFDSNYQLNNGFVFSKNERRLHFFLEPTYAASETGKNQTLFKRVDDVIEQWQLSHPEVSVHYFGGAAVAAANAAQMRQDTILTMSITIILLLALTWYVFRRKRAPFILMIPVVFGALCGLSVTALVQGSVSIIALGAGAIILGIAIDFSVHFMSHARSHPDMRENLRGLVMPLTLGAITTVGAFLALRLASAPILKDLGLFAAAGLTGASLFTLIFLPHLLQSATKDNTVKLDRTNFIDRIAAWQPEHNKWLAVVVLLATPVFWYFSRNVEFDSDLMKLNYLSPKLAAAQAQLNEDNSLALSSIFVVSKDTNANNAAEKLERINNTFESLKGQGSIRSYINPTDFLPSIEEQQKRIQRWNDYWTEHKQVEVIAQVHHYAQEAGFSKDAFDAFTGTITNAYTPYDSATVAFITTLLPASLNQYNGAHYAIAILKVQPGSRAAILQAFDDNTEVVVTDKQSVSEKLLEILGADFNTILLYSGLLVFLALLIAYGRIELALISFLPMAVTWIWILGIMALFNLKFNIVNIIISTLIFGLGDDYSIFMMDSLMERYRTGTSKIKSARSAVYLSVLTTIIGLGTLLFAQHPALQSIAIIAVTGLLCVVFVSQVLQPFLFNFLIQRRADKGFMPFTLWSFIKSTFSFIYFFIGCLLVTIAGFLLIGLKPFGKTRSKYLFHFILSKYTGSVMYVMANVTKRVIKSRKDIFDRPRVYIANHSSFLDILLTTMLHPKLVLLTNKWVWRSPVFGKIVRMAEYYPVADGAEGSIEPLRNLVERGYGIVVFPEGTRSYDDTIHRFHKGAFYIAEQLQLEIVPIVMHGVNYTMQKGDWLLKDGTTTVKILDPIAINDESFGANYSARTKSIMKWFRSQFTILKEANETPKYFREQIIKSNIYKGPVLEWYCRIKTKLEDNYEPFHALLPRQGKFYDLGCGYGFMTSMLYWASPDRQFTGVDYDQDKIQTASNNYTFRKKTKDGIIAAQKNLDFVHADVTQFELEPCDGIIISDVLHYLLPQAQEALLNRCFNALNTDGMLILRDGVAELEERHEGTKLTELFSTRIFKFNKTQNELHFISRKFIESWAHSKQLKLSIIDNTSRTSNLIFVMTKAHS